MTLPGLLKATLDDGRHQQTNHKIPQERHIKGSSIADVWKIPFEKDSLKYIVVYCFKLVYKQIRITLYDRIISLHNKKQGMEKYVNLPIFLQ